MPLFEQFDLALTLCANQFAGRSIALDKFVNRIAYLPLLNGGVFLAAFFWLWFEADETTVCAQRRNVVAALLGGIVIAGVSHLLKALLQLHYLPLHYTDHPSRCSHTHPSRHRGLASTGYRRPNLSVVARFY